MNESIHNIHGTNEKGKKKRLVFHEIYNFRWLSDIVYSLETREKYKNEHFHRLFAVSTENEVKSFVVFVANSYLHVVML